MEIKKKKIIFQGEEIKSRTQLVRSPVQGERTKYGGD